MRPSGPTGKMSELAETGGHDRRPLVGRRILVTRAAAQAEALTAPLKAMGADPVVCPTIEIVPAKDPAELEAALENLAEVDFLVLSSVNAVEFFFRHLETMGLGLEDLPKALVVAVGPKTAEAIEARGLAVDLMPTDFQAEGIVDLIKDRVFGKRVLYPRAGLARDLIPRQLAAAGARVLDPVTYTSVPPAGTPEKLRQALAGGLDLITFTASSTVRNFINLVPRDLLEPALQVPVASIGPLTSRTARECGLRVVVEPKDSTLDAMLEAIRDYFAALKTEQ